jgi:hypothetical protein
VRTVVGGCLAALVAADALGRDGAEVELLLPARGVGGGFAPLRREGRELELGVRLLELEYEGVGTPPPLAEYAPGGHRPFVRRIAAWAHELLGERLVRTEDPLMLAGGRLGRDLLFATDPLALRDVLTAHEREAAAAQAGAAALRLGPSGLTPGDLTRTDLERASRAMHGELVHRRLIAPYVDKLVPGGASAVVAALRRKAWVPLLWPRTVAEACGDGEVGFRPHRPFWRVDGAGGVIGALLERLRALPRVRIVEGVTLQAARPTSRGVALCLDGAADRVVARPVLGVPLPCYTPARATSTIAWVTGVHDVPALVNVVDPELPVARLSGRDGVLTCELRHDAGTEDVLPGIVRTLDACGIGHDGPELVTALSAPTFALPTPANVAAHAAARWRLERLAAEVVGGAAGFDADSFNEQVVQGLRAAEALR